MGISLADACFFNVRDSLLLESLLGGLKHKSDQKTDQDIVGFDLLAYAENTKQAVPFYKPIQGLEFTKKKRK